MARIARIIGRSLLPGGPGAGLKFAFFGKTSDGSGISRLLACVGEIVAAPARTEREAVTAFAAEAFNLRRTSADVEVKLTAEENFHP